MLTYERARKVAEETLGSRTAANSYTNGTHAVFYPAPTVVADGTEVPVVGLGPCIVELDTAQAQVYSTAHETWPEWVAHDEGRSFTPRD